MTIKEFLEKFVNSTDVEKTCKKHILEDKYVPYEEKIAHCTAIVNNTSYIKAGEDKIYNRNTPAQYVQFTLTIISLYTDIDIDFDNVLETFNSLDKHGAIDALIANMPQAEYSKFTTILNMVSDDMYENNRTIVGYIDGIVQPFKALLNNEKLMEKIQELLPNE